MQTIISRTPLMKDMVIIFTTLAVSALVIFVYIKLKPIVIIPPETAISQCPSRWMYDVDSKECQPQYATQCKAFNPDQFTTKEKCDIVTSCGTDWKGLCGF